jgi:putative sterol carrier protein
MSGSTTRSRPKAGGMTEFLQALEQRGREPALDRTSGSVRFDADRNGGSDHWRLEIRRGAVTVSRDADRADCVVRAKAEVLDDIATGRANALTAMLRGDVSIEGDPRLLVRIQRIFPSPTGRRKIDSSRMVGRRRG